MPADAAPSSDKLFVLFTLIIIIIIPTQRGEMWDADCALQANWDASSVGSAAFKHTHIQARQAAEPGPSRKLCRVDFTESSAFTSESGSGFGEGGRGQHDVLARWGGGGAGFRVLSNMCPLPFDFCKTIIFVLIIKPKA